MYLNLPKNLATLQHQAKQIALQVFRPNSRKYDKAEHAYPKELDILAALLDGMNAASTDGGAGAAQARKDKSEKHDATPEVKNGANLATLVGAEQLCYGDTGFLLSMPRQGLGNAAIGAVSNAEQLKRFSGIWAAMAITEPSTGSDSANISTTATQDGDYYVLNGEKIFVTSGERADAVVVWATLDKKLGRAAIKSFVVEKGTPGMTIARLEHKLGIRSSDTAAINFDNCRVHKSNLLGNAEIDVKKGFAGVMETFDNTRPLVACMALGCAQAALERAQQLLAEQIAPDYLLPVNQCNALQAEWLKLEADLEAARLLTYKAAWMADNRQPNSKEASMAKAKAGRVCNAITLKCVELCGIVGYSEAHLLEKWARDSKILDIFEGTQQIQLLIIARRLLDKSSAELR